MARAFISYARADGEKFATSLRERLEKEESEITLWQDRTDMEGGVGWWKQITEALETVQFLILVMTPGALRSEITAKEWRYARQEGVCVCPVKGVPDEELDYASLPQWMSRAQFYDLENEWETFVNFLKSPCRATRVSFMAPALPAGFVERPAEFEQLKSSLLSEGKKDPVAITTSLLGAGGFGKTTLAAALCHDDDIITAFNDGILWVTLGENPDIRLQLTKMYRILTGEKTDFIDEQEASVRLSEKLADKDCLLIIDDVWNTAHLRPFLGDGDSCARIITTRNFEIVADAECVNVDEMTSGEAVELLTKGLKPTTADRRACEEIAGLLGEWPLLLELAGARLRQRVTRGDSLTNALDHLIQLFNRYGVRAFDHRNPIERNQAVELSLKMSFELLEPEELQRYKELAIFPEDTDIPSSTISALWGLDNFETEELLQTLSDYSLLKFDLQSATIRLHDVIRSYLLEQLRDHAAVHARLLEGWGDFYSFPDRHAWRWFSYHMVKARREEDLRKLLLDYDWIRAKLEAIDVAALISDYDYPQGDENLRLIQGALRLSAHVLLQDRSQLAEQLWGRLLSFETQELQNLLNQAKRCKQGLWLRPLAACLTPPGGPLVRILTGHNDWVSAVAVTPDGRFAISGSDDNTLKIWDLESGKETFTLQGHNSWVSAVAVTLDGRYAVSGSADNTLKVWDLESVTEALTLQGHNSWVKAVAVAPDGRFAVSGSADNTLKVWDLESGKETLKLQGHNSGVNAVAVTPDGRFAVSGSYDNTLKVWDLESGEDTITLEGHNGQVNAVAVTPDGRFAISGSADSTLKVWDLENGEETLTLQGHHDPVSAVAVTPDGRFALSGSDDKTLKVWDLESGKETLTLQGHNSSVYAVAVTSDGRLAISGSADNTLKVWDLESGVAAFTLQGHNSWVNAVAVTPDGRFAISGSWDNTLKVWDMETFTLQGHNSSVYAVAVTPDGRFAISGSDDKTLKVWNLESGKESLALQGHNSSVYAVAVTPDGRFALSSSADKTLRIWDLESGVETFTLQGHDDSVRTMALTPDGRFAVSGSADKTLKVWDLESGKETFTLQGHDHSVSTVEVTPDGRFALSGSDDYTLKVWDMGSGEEVLTLHGHNDWVSAVAVTPDGRSAISGSADKTLKVWDLESGKETLTLQGHDRSVRAVAVTPDGRFALSGSWDNTLKIWDLESGEETASFVCDCSILSCSVSPDGKTIVAGGSSGVVHFLRLEGV